MDYVAVSHDSGIVLEDAVVVAEQVLRSFHYDCCSYPSDDADVSLSMVLDAARRDGVDDYYR